MVGIFHLLNDNLLNGNSFFSGIGSLSTFLSQNLTQVIFKVESSIYSGVSNDRVHIFW